MMYRATDDQITKNWRDYGFDTERSVFGNHKDPNYSVMDALSESSSPEFIAYLAGASLKIDNEANTLEWIHTIDVCAVLEAVATLVIHEYDHVIGQKGNMVLWNAFDLHGDDAVDYFGGYLRDVARALDCWVKHNPSTYS